MTFRKTGPQTKLPTREKYNFVDSMFPAALSLVFIAPLISAFTTKSKFYTRLNVINDPFENTAPSAGYRLSHCRSSFKLNQFLQD